MRLGKRERIERKLRLALLYARNVRRDHAPKPGHTRSVWDNMAPRGTPCRQWGMSRRRSAKGRSIDL